MSIRAPVPAQAYANGALSVVIAVDDSRFATLSTGEGQTAIDVDPEGVDVVACRFSKHGVTRFTSGAVVDAKQLLLRVEALFRACHVSEMPGFYVLCSLYVVLTHVFTVATSVPYLAFIGPIGSGKTRLGELFEGLAFNGHLAVSFTTAALYRLLAWTKGTLILDEESHSGRSLSQVLRAGYRSTGKVTFVADGRIVSRCCYGPKIFLSNEELRDPAVGTRTLHLYTSVANPSNEPPKPIDAAVVQALVDDLQIFALRNASSIEHQLAEPMAIDGLYNRDAELGALLLAIARHIDAQPGPSLSLCDQLIDYLKRQADDRKLTAKLFGEEVNLARVVVEAGQDLAPAGEHRGESAIAAAGLKDYVNSSGIFDRRYDRCEELGAKLRRWGLVKRCCVLRVSSKTSTKPPVSDEEKRQEMARKKFGEAKSKSWQRRCYVLDLERARIIAGIPPRISKEIGK